MAQSIQPGRFGHIGRPDNVWLAKQEDELILEPELPIPRIARLITIMADGFLTALGKAPTEFGVLLRLGRLPPRLV